jgi:hypothetical protein
MIVDAAVVLTVKVVSTTASIVDVIVLQCRTSVARLDLSRIVARIFCYLRFLTKPLKRRFEVEFWCPIENFQCLTYLHMYTIARSVCLIGPEKRVIKFGSISFSAFSSFECCLCCHFRGGGFLGCGHLHFLQSPKKRVDLFKTSWAVRNRFRP